MHSMSHPSSVSQLPYTALSPHFFEIRRQTSVVGHLRGDVRSHKIYEKEGIERVCGIDDPIRGVSSATSTQWRSMSSRSVTNS